MIEKNVDEYPLLILSITSAINHIKPMSGDLIC